MKSKGFIIQVGILILSLLVISILTGCGNQSNNTSQVTKYSVAGTVLDAQGIPITNVSIAIKGNEIQDSSVEVDENGMWSAADLQGEVTITPVKDDWTFTPPEVIVSEKDDGKNDFNFVGQEIIFPGVETLTPGENTTGVEPGAVVAVEFNQDVTEVDLTGITITDSGTNPVGGVTASLSGKILTINHADFNSNTIYTVTVPANTVENNDGIGNKGISWSFTTRGTLGPPTVNSLTPADNSIYVELAAVVSVEFTQDIIEEDLSGISIITDDGSTTITGVSASLSSRTITISHDDFDYNKTYTVTVPAGAVTNTDGIENGEISWSFTTRDTLPAPTYIGLIPEENATDVEPGATVLIELSRAITAEDLSGISITTDGGSTMVTGVSASLSDRIIFINHDDFDYGKTYTVTIPAGAVANTDGIDNEEISWSFTVKEVYVFIRKWGSGGIQGGEFNGPGYIAFDNSGDIYITDNSNYRVQKFDSSGIYLDQWGSQGSGDGQFEYPGGIVTDDSGNIYVCDTHNHRVQKFNSEGIYQAQWGDPGSENGEFYFPAGITIDSSGNLYVADQSNHRIQKFDSSGTYLGQWGSQGSGDGQLYMPKGIAVDSLDNIYVVEYYNHRVQKFDSSGTYLTQWGSEGGGNGEFINPVGIAVDTSGNVYVVDSYNHRVQKFDSSGTYLTQWGSEGDGNGQFFYPYGVEVDSSGNVYVADYNNDRIQVFAPAE